MTVAILVLVFFSFAHSAIAIATPDNSLPRFKYSLEDSKGKTYEGGTFSFVDVKRFPISSTMTGATLELRSKAIREMHWHPNADELLYRNGLHPIPMVYYRINFCVPKEIIDKFPTNSGFMNLPEKAK